MPLAVKGISIITVKPYVKHRIPPKKPWRIMSIGAVIVFIILVLIITIVTFFWAQKSNSPSYEADEHNTKRFKLQLPVDRVIIMDTPVGGCKTHQECAYRLQFIQLYRTEEKKWYDIAYNFMVGGDGTIYEGRGWNLQGSHTKGFNNGSIGISFIGSFTKLSPSQRQFNALKVLLETGVNKQRLTKHYKVYPQRALIDTKSPGTKIVEVIKNWPNYFKRH